MDKIVEFEVSTEYNTSEDCIASKWKREPKDVKEALECSIMKWEMIVKVLESDSFIFPLKDGGTITCALCHMFNGRASSLRNYCKGCPIREHTGFNECIKTPYNDYYNAMDNKDALKAAKEEVEFLISLQNKNRKDIGEKK